MLLLALVPARAQPQGPSPEPKFEVASIKQAFFEDEASFGGFSTSAGTCNRVVPDISGDRVTLLRATLCGLVRLAYGLRDFQVAGIPDLMKKTERSNFYDVDTRTGFGTPTPEQLTAMLKALLADRFRLQFHYGTKEVPVYALTGTGKGLRFDKRPNDCTVGLRFGPGLLSACAPTMLMGDFAQVLSRFTDRPVVDRTGVTDKFAFDLKWDPVNGAPSIFTAIQEQVGLKLTPTQAPVDVLIVDHVEPPTPD
jgi:uncharacterized protein (TIGR03435 family)